MNNNDPLYQNCFLASYALFKVMYDKEQNIPSVISKFIKNIIISKRLRNFSEFDIKTHLKSEYGFELPIAIIKTSLKKIPEISRSVDAGYQMTILPNSDKLFSEQLSQLETDRAFLLERLFEYIEREKTNILTTHEKDSIVSSLQKFLLSESSNSSFHKEISAFIIKNQKNEKINHILEEIKKGIILYTGLTYNENPNDFGAFSDELTIFLDLEILFHGLGYNGELCKHLFFDFYELVKEINEKTLKKTGKKDIIKLKYFCDVEKNFINFFKTAESIIREEIQMDPSTSAMPLIINGCKEPSDVIKKRTDAKLQLEKLHIYTANDEYYNDSNNYKYNQESKEALELYKNKFPGEKESSVAEKIKFINYIAISRQNRRPIDFEHAKFILLTDKQLTLSIGNEMKGTKEVPLSMSLAYLTNKLWFKLNKGFSLTSFPTSFKVITKAQLIMSNEVSTFVSESYKKLNDDINKKKLNRDEAISCYHELLRSMKYPEQINLESINSIEQDIISISDVWSYGNSLSKTKEELSDIKTESLRKDKKIETMSISLNTMNFENMQLKNKLEQLEKEKQLDKFRSKEIKYKEKLENFLNNRLKRYKLKFLFKKIFFLFLFFICVATSYVIPKSLTHSNTISFVISVIVMSVFYFLIPIAKKQINELLYVVFSKRYRKKQLDHVKMTYIEEFKKKEPPPELK